MSMRWLVPSAAASPRRLRSPTPCSATYSIAAASSRSRAGVPSLRRGIAAILALGLYHVVHVPIGTPLSSEPGAAAMARQRIEHRATTTADPATVYALLRDGATWPEWAPIDAFELERDGRRRARGRRRRPRPALRPRDRPRHDLRARREPPLRLHARVEPAGEELPRRRRPRARRRAGPRSAGCPSSTRSSPAPGRSCGARWTASSRRS